MERTLRGPWPPELSHLEKLYKDYGLLFRAFLSIQAIPYSSTLAVGTVLKELGEDVEYLNVSYEFGIPLTEELNAKRHEKMTKYIAKGGYDVVGISCTSVLEGVATKRVAEAAKRASEDIKVVVGGYQAASEAFDMIQKIPAIDVIVLSDFEPIAELLYASLNGRIPIGDVPNVVYRENGKIRASERKYIKLNPEDIPVYDYSLIKKYIPEYSLFVLETSRGCLYNCSFCQEKVLRQSYTVKDATTAVDEIIDTTNYIGQFVEKAVFLYCDAMWGASPKWVKDFCSQLADRKEEITADALRWMIEGRIGQFDDEALSLMKKARCNNIAYGVESLSPKMLTIMNKTRNPHEYINSVFDTVEKTLERDMHAALLFIFGMPGETPSTIEETLNSIRKLSIENRNLHLKLGLPVILRGTDLDEQTHDPQFIEKYGVRILDENDWEKAYIPRYTQLFDPSRELSASEMTDIYMNFTYGTGGLTASFGKQVEAYETIKAILNKNEISPEDLARMSIIYRKILAGIS